MSTKGGNHPRSYREFANKGKLPYFSNIKHFMTSTMNNRDTAFDITKAIGILLMILVHCSGLPHLLRNFIFSFHMPLFFIVSGYFYKPKAI